MIFEFFSIYRELLDRAQAVQSARVTRISDLRPGTVAVYGTARAIAPVQSIYHESDVAFRRATVSVRSYDPDLKKKINGTENQQTERFVLEDTTGQIEIDPIGATFYTPHTCNEELQSGKYTGLSKELQNLVSELFGAYHIVLSGNWKMQVSETVVPEGSTVLIIGEYSVYEDQPVIEAGIFKGSIFIISNYDQKALGKRLARGLRHHQRVLISVATVGTGLLLLLSYLLL